MAKKVPKVYLVRNPSQTASTTVEVSIGIGGRDFLLEAIALYCTVDTNGGFRFNFVPSDTGRKWSNERITAAALCGDVKDVPKPYRIDGGPHADPRQDAPLFIKRGSTITVELQEVSGSANTIEVALVGHELIGA